MAVNSEQNKPWTLTLTHAVSNLFQAGSDFPSSNQKEQLDGLEGRLYNIDKILGIVTENVEIPPYSLFSIYVDIIDIYFV